MQANKKNFSFLILPVLIFLSVGCLPFQESAEVILGLGSNQKHSPQVETPKRFEKSVSQGPTVIESALELSKKYAELSEETAVLKQKNQDLIAENHRLKDHLADLEPELKQAKKELAQANDLLIEMRIELNNWKTDILGFRNEMRTADTEQLRALLKILEVLGGEAKAESEQNENEKSNVVSANKPGKLQLKETIKSNE